MAVAAEEDHSAVEHAVLGTVSADGAEIYFPAYGVAWRRASDLFRSACEQGLPSLRIYTMSPRPDGAHVPYAAACIREHGFVVLEDVLGDEQLEVLERGCMELERDLLVADQQCHGHRGPGRYSFGRAKRHWWLKPCEARPEWAALAGLPAIASVVRELLGADALCISVGGDFVLAGTSEMQFLHSDLGGWPDAYADFDGHPPFISVNFVIRPVDALDGPLRIVPGTHLRRDAPPWRDETYALQNGLAPLRPGTAILRDVRAWHSGTPNLGSWTRHLPSCEFVPQAYVNLLASAGGTALTEFGPLQGMPAEIYDKLTAEGRWLCRHLRSPDVQGRIADGPANPQPAHADGP